MEIAFVSQFDEGYRIFRYVSGTAGPICLIAGAGDPLEESYCARVADGRVPNLIHDAQTEPSVADLAATHALQIGAHVSVPIVMSGGRIYGTFCCFSRSADDSLTDRDIDMLRMMAALVAGELETDELQTTAAADGRARTRAAMRPDGLKMFFQPVVRMSDSRVLFYEALARFQGVPVRSPDLWFADAWSAGLGSELELFAMRQAMLSLAVLPPEVKLSLNLSPETTLDPAMSALLESVDAFRVIIEVTEHAVVNDYPPLQDALNQLRSLGASLAIDDVGSGHSGLRSLVELRPDVLKLDISITRGLTHDPVRRSMAEAVVAYAWGAGVLVVAEGIESREEAETLQSLGIGLGQGYLFGRPAPLDALGPWHTSLPR